MFGTIVISLIIGFVVGALGMFLFAKSNEEKFVKALGMDLDDMVEDLLSKTEIDDNVKEFIDKIKAKVKK